jgi:hypothetical protein
MTTSSQLTSPHAMSLSGKSKSAILALSVVNAGLLIASGAIHLHLWNIAYRHVTQGHMNVLFFIQFVAAFVAAAAVLVLRRVIVSLGAAALAAGTFTGFLISRYRTAGLFGFHDAESTSWSRWALAVEITATVLLLANAWLISRRNRAS